MKKQKKTSIEGENIKRALKEACNDKNCHIHGRLKTRGRIFRGKVLKKFRKRVVVEFKRMIYVRKYERYTESKTRIHARLPECMDEKIKAGDYVKIQECRPLSKLIHFTVLQRITAENAGGEGEK